MFIVCTNCEFKYLVNSADLKPKGRMVECVNCGHQWFQDINELETFSAVPATNQLNLESNKISKLNEQDKNKKIKNLPSTEVRQEKPSTRNSIILLLLIFTIFFGIWFLRSYGINTFVLIEFYIIEFFFNLNLIITDLARIIHNILN